MVGWCSMGTFNDPWTILDSYSTHPYFRTSAPEPSPLMFSKRGFCFRLMLHTTSNVHGCGAKVGAKVASRSSGRKKQYEIIREVQAQKKDRKGKLLRKLLRKGLLFKNLSGVIYNIPIYSTNFNDISSTDSCPYHGKAQEWTIANHQPFGSRVFANQGSFTL